MKRLLIAIAVGLLVTAARLAITAPSDMYWPHCAARALLANGDPYGPACMVLHLDGTPWVVNPLPTALAMLPFAPLPLDLATALMLGLSSALMAYGLLRDGDPSRLAIFLSAPFLLAWYYGQWAPLILGVALTPALLPLVLVKPHVGLPILLTSLTRRRVLAVAIFGLASLIVMPSWPLRWLALVGSYDGYIPLLTPIGLAALLLLFRWRDSDARYVLLCALVPQRGAYDPLILVSVLRSRTEMIFWVVCGWLILWFWPTVPRAFESWLFVAATYLPIVAIILARRYVSFQLNSVIPQGHVALRDDAKNNTSSAVKKSVRPTV